MKMFNKLLSVLLVFCMVLAMVPVEVFAVESNPSLLTTDIGSKTFYIGEATEFTFTTTANDDVNKMVLGSFVFSDPSAIEKLEYRESKDGNWYEFSGDFGPAGGFPMIDGTSTFRATFNKAGDFTVTATMKLADGTGNLCSTQSNVTVSDHKPSQLTTNIGTKTFKVGQTTEFTFTTTANDDLNTMVLGSFVFSDPTAIAKLEYLETKNGNWYEFSGDFGPATGFPMIDGTSTFRVTFNKVGTYSVTAFMKTAVGGSVLCSTTQNVTVADKVMSVLTSDISSKTFAVGDTTEFTVTTTANDYAGTMVLGSIEFSDPTAIAKLEYLETKDGNWYEFSGDFGPAGGFPMINGTSTFRVTFSKAGDYTVTASMKRADNGEVLCSTGAIAVNVLAKYKVTVSTNIAGAGTISPSNESVVKAGETATFTVAANAGYQIDSIGGATSVDIADDKMSATVTVTPESDVTVVVNFIKTFTVKVTHTANGTVVSSPTLAGGSVTVVTGTTMKVIATPDEGYRVSAIEVKSGNKVIKSETFDIHAYEHIETLTVDRDYEITVTFAETIYKVTITTPENGTVTIDDEDGIVNHGGSTTMTVVADEANGYEIGSVTVNGNPVELDAEGKFTISDIKEDKTIVATFVLKQYDVTIGATENGTVTANVSKVEHGGNVFVTIIPNAGYSVGSVKVNGAEVTSLNEESDEKVTFTISGCTVAQHIEVAFVVTEGAPSAVTELFNNTDAIRVDGMMYVYKNNGTITFSTDKNGIRIYIQGQRDPLGGSTTKKITIDKDVVITKIELRYKAENSNQNRWHGVEGISNENPMKLVIDTTNANVAVNPAQANANGYYNSDVNVDISVEDPGDYAGIASVKYWVVKDGDSENPTQSETLYIGNIATATWTGSITVDAALNNSDNVVVYVEVTDRAGNTTTTNTALKINCTAPVLESIEVVKETKQTEAMPGYYTYRRVELTITDRATTFNSEAAKSGVVITAINAAGIPVTVSPSMVSCTSTGNTHVVTLEFAMDANYEWTVSYTNLADMEMVTVNTTTNAEDIYNFTVDATAPTGIIKYEDSVWSELLETLSFGIWSSDSMVVTAEQSDATSPLKDIQYYKSNSTKAMTEDELTEMFTAGNFTTWAYTINADEKFAVYARIVDYAGNVTYIGTDGMVYDNTESAITITPEPSNKNGFYNKNVNVNISVSEILTEGAAYSGIKTIDYKVVMNGDYDNPTQSGNLYTFNVKNPKYEDLVPSWNGDITVQAGKNNHDNIKVVVTVVDNAGKVSVKETSLSIDIDVLSATIQVDGEANKIIGDRGYFNVAERVATITLNDRGSSFDKDAATAGISITATNAEGKVVENAYTISDWSSNGNTHTAIVTFLADANYTWSFSYTDKADNTLDVSKNLSTDKSVTPFIFTVDDTDPVGSATINTNVWDELLDVLTFGLFSNTSFTVVADAEDQTSPVVIQYYKTDKVTAMTTSELDAVQFVDYTEAYTESYKQQKSLTIEDEERFVVYLKMTDYAGNYIYVNSDGAIVDKTSADIVLTPETPNANGFYGMPYGDTVDVAVKVTDVEPYSGIKTVDYWIVKDGNEQEPTQSDNLFTFSNTAPLHADLVYEWNGNIPVYTELNNSCNVVVHVKVVDNAGNEYETTQALDIDITAPAISVRYDDNDARNEKYFDDDRTATIVITERTHHFDEVAATNGITITAVDAKGNAVEIDPAAMISSWETKEGATTDAATHTATISYTTDANYTFSISYTDKADNANSAVNTGSSVAPYEFTVDKVAPVGTITGTSEEGRTTTWDKLVTDLTFGFWSGKKITVTGTSDDVTSPIESVQYYKVSNAEALTEAELAKVTTWTAFESLVAVPNEQFTVYLKITDNAGNVTYISTDGMILDDTAPREEAIAPEITVTPEQPINGLYNRDVKISIEVLDPSVGDTFAGLKTITYRVLNLGKETQSGTLYSFENEKPGKADLLQKWTGEIVVDSKLNNSNDVVIEIFAEDNAGNTSKDSVAIKIDITAPRIDISYNNNNPDSGSYYNADRVATIRITERNFKAEDVKITITNTDGTIPTIPTSISDWTEVVGTGNLDNTTYTATIRYSADGDYKFDIAYTDLAANPCAGATYAAGTQNPTEFTIDQTNPVIRVSYNNNEAANGKYFHAARTATITIIEHNFDVNRVIFTQTADRGGVTPNIAWTNNGDTHTATISYTADGDYTFDVTMTDMAGNSSGAADYGNSVAGKDFVIDTTYEDMITIGGVENGKAYGYSDDVIPTIDISDINLEEYTVTLIGIQKDTIIDLTEEVNDLLNVGVENVSGIFDIFEVVQNMDGIYTLTLTSQDKAGNQDAEEITFTVNRFGSVYVYDEYLMNLISNGGAYVLSVTDDLVIYEYNADKLVSGSLVIEITCDGKPLENVIYEVTPEINDRVAVGESGWYQYRYTISKDNFVTDGVYKISVSSKDATGNTPENNRYEDMGITFHVDSTLAEISSIVGLEEAIINATEQEVKYTVYDTMGIKSIKIYVNGELVDEITDFSEDLNNYSGSFVLTEQSSAQSVRIVVEDMSGNITDTDAEDFSSAYEFNKTVTVSTNFFVRWYANKPLFWGSIIGAVVLAGGLWFFLIAKRKKKEEEEATAK